MIPAKYIDDFADTGIRFVVVGLDHSRELLEADLFELHERSARSDQSAKILNRKTNILPFFIPALICADA
jgi:hypothetical protein